MITEDYLVSIEQMARETRPRIGSWLYGAVLSLGKEVRRLQAIEAAARGLQQADPYYPGNTGATSMVDAMDRLYKLLDAREATS